jgi:hypothetical protein
MVWTGCKWGKLLYASMAGAAQKINHDDDAHHDLHILLLLL